MAEEIDFDIDNIFDDHNDISLKNSLIDELKIVWRNERAAPELLPYNNDLVNNIKDQVDIQQRVLNREARTHPEQFEQNLYRQELDRVKYVLASYLRCRLQKIERFVLYILSNEEMTNRLSEKEYNYAVGYADLVEKHLMLSFLNNIPATFRGLDTMSNEEKMVPAPNLDAHVVVHVNDDIGAFAIAEDDEVELNKDDVLFARYRPFRDLLESRHVKLL